MFGFRDRKDKVKLTKASYVKAKRLFAFMRPYRFVYTIGWLFLIASSLTSMLFPALMGQLLGADKEEPPIVAIADWDMRNIDTLLLLMLAVFGIQAICSFFRILIFNNVTERTLFDIKRDAFSRLVHLPIDFFNRNKVGELVARIATDINLIQETLNTTIAEFFRQFVSIAVALGLMFYFSWELALWMLTVVPLLALAAIVFGRYIRKLSKSAQDESAQSNAVLEEVLTGIVNVKAFTNERYEIKRFGQRIFNAMKINTKRGLMRGFFVSFIIFGLFGGVTFVIWKAKGMQELGMITDAEFKAFILYTLFLGASFGAIPDLYAKIQKAIGSTEQLMNLLEEKTECDQGNALTRFSGKVRFKQVSFSYPQRPEVEVLKDISFSCRPGETIALVGRSGAGKSTISSLLLHFYELDSGSIELDDHPIDTISKTYLRSQIAVVPQEVLLFGGTIRENIRYGNPQATDEQIIDAAKKANAYAFIQSFPEQFDTLVGDRGIQLSGGQKQRIAIARAVLKDPKILILDEATSALDAQSEQLVQEALLQLMRTRTSFVIAHRLSTVKHADTILVIENGEIAEQGTHEALIANQEGVYYKLNRIQFEDEQKKGVAL